MGNIVEFPGRPHVFWGDMEVGLPAAIAVATARECPLPFPLFVFIAPFKTQNATLQKTRGTLSLPSTRLIYVPGG